MTTTIRKRAKSKNAVSVELTPNQPLEQLLTPEQFEVITAAHYAQPESRTVLQLFLQVNYMWQVSRHMQGKTTGVKQIDWPIVEQTSAQLIRNTLDKLLGGVDATPWSKQIPERFKKI